MAVLAGAASENAGGKGLETDEHKDEYVEREEQEESDYIENIEGVYPRKVMAAHGLDEAHDGKNTCEKCADKHHGPDYLLYKVWKIALLSNIELDTDDEYKDDGSISHK